MVFPSLELFNHKYWKNVWAYLDKSCSNNQVKGIKSFASSGSFTVPSSVYSIDIFCVGGGGGAVRYDDFRSSGAGGGGDGGDSRGGGQSSGQANTGGGAGGYGTTGTRAYNPGGSGIALIRWGY